MSLWNQGIQELLDQTASDAPTPGGGSVAGLTASFGLGLVIMALEISKPKKNADVTGIDALLIEARELLTILKTHADRDVAAFERYMDALKLPKGTEERKTAVKDATRNAALTPLEAAKDVLRALQLGERAAALAHNSIISDVGAGVAVLQGAGQAFLLTVDMNLKYDADLNSEFRADRDQVSGEMLQVTERVMQQVQGILS
ncbi:cyclodeaminase/cyclohydrolase family protein [Deinococcus cellulosilyticus]|uniref:Serine cycle enzyme n=1 Tax=Deinococcus cellulosilyticus (strain DSM 18568 / NBRC 106333 / KACC 11606 / 5516J-15) TaxID=1223518 RepID=A0A511MWW2_DEIC1|nr:cyclodeaminase/cyclohydrolase family protein [Deinococcus cellulosilyticus]GEM45062.1 serine cycle enzyme [Deinococcus cellulosilyticus NBRC 106333 = KACC 11606]